MKKNTKTTKKEVIKESDDVFTSNPYFQKLFNPQKKRDLDYVTYLENEVTKWDTKLEVSFEDKPQYPKPKKKRKKTPHSIIKKICKKKV